jgi:hypothetical protein
MEWVRLSPFQYIYSSFNSGMFDIDCWHLSRWFCAHTFFNGSLRDCNMPIRTILVELITWKHAMMVCVSMVRPKWTNTHERTIMDGWMDVCMDGWMMHGQDTFKLDGWMDGAWTYVWRVNTLSLKLGFVFIVPWWIRHTRMSNN